MARDRPRRADPEDLGVASIRLIASRERRYVGIDGFGIEIEATEILEG